MSGLMSMGAGKSTDGAIGLDLVHHLKLDLHGFGAENEVG
jgi:hypothetical protein